MAALGCRAPVAIDVATAFAVSWNPFVKSKARAVIITMARITETSDTSVQAHLFAGT
jgi:hypothetical protein